MAGTEDRDNYLEQERRSEELTLSLIRKFITGMFEEMIEKGIIDVSRTEDKEYVKSVMVSNGELISTHIKNIRLLVELHRDFREFAKVAFKNGKHEIGIVLTVIAIEHILNIFFDNVLIRKGIRPNDLNQIIRRTNFDDKIGWLMALVGGEFPNALKISINSLVDLRNSIVHYKPRQWMEDDDGMTHIRRKIEQLDINRVVGIIDELDKVLDSIFKTVSTNYVIARKLAETLIS